MLRMGFVEDVELILGIFFLFALVNLSSWYNLSRVTNNVCYMECYVI